MESHSFLFRTVVVLVVSFHTLPALVTANQTSVHHGNMYSTRNDTLFFSAQSDLPTPSNLLPTTSQCQNINETLSNKTGTIIVTETTARCSVDGVWNIVLPSIEDGIVIEFIHFDISFECSLNIMTPKSCNDRKCSFTTVDSSSLLLRENRIKIRLNKWPPFYNSGRHCGVFSLMYVAHPVRKMPRQISDQYSDHYHYYNCSGDIEVPVIFQCNWISECAGGEDEHQCEHADEDCEDWLPLREHCLKLYFDFRTVHVFQHIGYASEQLCSKHHGGQLAQLRDKDDVEQVGRIIDKSMFRGYDAVIAAQRTIPVSKRMSHLYRFMFQWGDKGSPMIFLQVKDFSRKKGTKCLYVTKEQHLLAKDCEGIMHSYLCMKPRSTHSQTLETVPLSVHLAKPSRQISQFPVKQCKDGSLVQMFHFCYNEKRKETLARSSYSADLFACRYGPPVHYTMVCDGNPDCPDISDETECGPIKFSPLLDSTFKCEQFQLIPQTQRCDSKEDCFDGSDEKECMFCAKDYHRNECNGICYPRHFSFLKNKQCGEYVSLRYDYPECHHCLLVVSMDGYGKASLQPANDSNMEGTFPCRDGDYFIPSFLVNNGERDCKYGEDENIPLTNFTCPGFYRCRDSYNCVDPEHVCDGIHHCLYKDDERYCDLVCPVGCLCEGHIFSCTHVSNVSDMLQARSLDLSGSSNISLHGLHVLELLQFLNLSNCGLNTVTPTDMPNLRILDYSFNGLKNLSSITIEGFFDLIYLDLSGNSFARVLDNMFWAFIRRSGLNNLRDLILRKTALHSIEDKSFRQLSHLEFLDIRDNSLGTYNKHVFWGLDSLQKLYTDDSMLCCPYFHSSDTIHCVAPFDELSSCSDLLRLNLFRVFLWLIAILAIVGNVAVGVYRLFGVKERTVSAFRVFVTNLCAADLIMGIYMLMIGIADARFQGQYVDEESVWKRSTVCAITGFIGFVSSEASALTICLITLDRALVLCFPLKAHLHIGVRSSFAACGVVWFVAVTLAAVPLLAELQFYGVSSICLPLPITRRQFSGQFYSFAVFIIFNFAIFVLIGLGQGIIYRAIVGARKEVGTSRQSQEMTIARRLFLVIVSDFCCWFPIGLMGILVVSGIPISGEVNVWAAIFILPLNSAFNPFLYTLNTFLEKQRADKMKKEAKRLLAKIEKHLLMMQPSAVEDLMRVCIRSQIVKRERILHILQVQDSSANGSPSKVRSSGRGAYVTAREEVSMETATLSR